MAAKMIIEARMTLKTTFRLYVSTRSLLRLRMEQASNARAEGLNDDTFDLGANRSDKTPYVFAAAVDYGAKILSYSHVADIICSVLENWNFWYHGFSGSSDNNSGIHICNDRDRAGMPIFPRKQNARNLSFGDFLVEPRLCLLMNCSEMF
jgi:hypothetical protein